MSLKSKICYQNIPLICVINHPTLLPKFPMLQLLSEAFSVIKLEQRICIIVSHAGELLKALLCRLYVGGQWRSIASYPCIAVLIIRFVLVMFPLNFDAVYYPQIGLPLLERASCDSFKVIEFVNFEILMKKMLSSKNPFEQPFNAHATFLRFSLPLELFA